MRCQGQVLEIEVVANGPVTQDSVTQQSLDNNSVPGSLTASLSLSGENAAELAGIESGQHYALVLIPIEEGNNGKS